MDNRQYLSDMPVHFTTHLLEQRATNGDRELHLWADYFDPENIVWSVTDGKVDYLTPKGKWKEAPGAIDGPVFRNFISRHSFDLETAQQKAAEELGGNVTFRDQRFIATPFDLGHNKEKQFSTLIHHDGEDGQFKVTTCQWHLILKDGTLSPHYIWDLDYKPEDPQTYRVDMRSALFLSSVYVSKLKVYGDTVFSLWDSMDKDGHGA